MPERNDRRAPDFEKGNLAAVSSGAYSPRIRDAYATELANWARNQRALHYLAEESFAPAVWRWAVRTAQADLLLDRLVQHHQARRTACSGCKTCRSLEERWQRFDRTAERAGERLGIDPRARAELLVQLRQAGVIAGPHESARGMLGDLAAALRVRWDAGDGLADLGSVEERQADGDEPDEDGS